MVLSIQNLQEYQMDSQWNFHEFNKAKFQGVIKKKSCRTVRRLPKCITKKLARQIYKNLKNITCYSCYESNKAGKCHTLLVSLIIPLTMTRMIQVLLLQDISEDQSSNLTEDRHGLTLHDFFSKVGLRKFVLASKLFVLRPYFICHLTA